MGANVHVCSDMSLFSSYQGAQTSSILMGNRSSTSVFCVGMVYLKLSLGKTVPLKNVQHAPTINRISLVFPCYVKMVTS